MITVTRQYCTSTLDQSLETWGFPEILPSYVTSNLKDLAVCSYSSISAGSVPLNKMHGFNRSWKEL